MVNEEGSPLQQSPTSLDDTEAHSGSDGPAGLVAGPLRMGIAGLLVGLLTWQVSYWAFPWFEAPEVAFRNEQSPSAKELQQAALGEATTETRNAVVLGLAVGALAALAFALVECVSRGITGRTLALTGIALALGAGIGAAGGYLTVAFQHAYIPGEEIDPLKRTIAIQGIFWLPLACGVGLGLALFTGKISLGLGTLLQAILSAVLFAIVYVPLATLLFPMDNAERTVPASSANIAVWAVGAFLLMGLMLGMSRVRTKK